MAHGSCHFELTERDLLAVTCVPSVVGMAGDEVKQLVLR
jgi:hypothetical protein